jgi:hypothetical protein
VWLRNRIAYAPIDARLVGGKILGGEYPDIPRKIMIFAWIGGKQNGCPLFIGSHLISAPSMGID